MDGLGLVAIPQLAGDSTMADLLQASSPTFTQVAIPREFEDHFGLNQSQINFLTEEAILWASSHGLLLRSSGVNHDPTTSTTGGVNFTHIPFCLVPVPYPAQAFHKGVALSPLYGRLVDRVSRDLDWLHSNLESVVHEDQFTARLLQLSKQVHSQGIQQKVYLGIHRSDYMLHHPTADAPSQLLQVELNTIASSFGCLSSLTSQLHRFLVTRYTKELAQPLEMYYNLPSSQKLDVELRLPVNPAIEELPNALAGAHAYYGVKDAAIVFVVQPNESNAVDQKWLEYQLWDRHHLRVLRRTLAEIHHQALIQDNGDAKHRLFLKQEASQELVEIAVVYFRAGYTPKDYPTDDEWHARTLVEQSFAIKCPSIAYHLAGTKKIQQKLAIPSELRRFLSEQEALQVEQSFAGLYGLEHDDPNLEQVKQMALANPQGFVLKPQREGGGNNFYGQQVAHAIRTMKPEELESYILMARIVPQETPAVLVRNSRTSTGNTMSELGMYITALFDDGQEIFNHHAGHLLRTKLTGTDEGGVAAGFAVLSGPLLVD